MPEGNGVEVRRSPVNFLGLLQVFLLAVGIAGTQAAEIRADKIGVCLLAPPLWQEKSAEKEVSLVPPDERQNAQKRRRLHLAIPASPASSLEEEMYGEMDRIGGRSGQGTSNTRKDFHGAVAVKTQSGIEGIRASFGDITTSKAYFGINKYYFRHRDGSIFKVCAHVYGDQTLTEEYDAIIMNGLRYENPTRLLPGDYMMVTFSNKNDQLDGIYSVSRDGFVNMPFIGKIKAEGLSASTLSTTLEREYDQQEIYKGLSIRVERMAKPPDIKPFLGDIKMLKQMESNPFWNKKGEFFTPKDRKLNPPPQ